MKAHSLNRATVITTHSMEEAEALCMCLMCLRRNAPARLPDHKSTHTTAAAIRDGRVGARVSDLRPRSIPLPSQTHAT